VAVWRQSFESSIFKLASTFALAYQLFPSLQM
jgi:hypothetical protein